VAAVICQLLRDLRDGFRNGVEYLWYCRWIP